jgi:hypothetical protein
MNHLPTFKKDNIFLPQSKIMGQLNGIEGQKRITLELFPCISEKVANDYIETPTREKVILYGFVSKSYEGKSNSKTSYLLSKPHLNTTTFQTHLRYPMKFLMLGKIK